MILADFGYRCEECGFVYEEELHTAVAVRILTWSNALSNALRRAADPAQRRNPAVWSPLEYACHLRDVLLVQRERVLEARRTDTPSFSPMGRDERVTHDGYASQDSEAVIRQLCDAALMFSNVLQRLGPTDWDRTLMYNFPAKAIRSLKWVAVHTLHEAVHHHGDIERLDRMA